ncbi:MAG TPA: DUF3619 family protein [Methylibium sp.]|uniref:DUF3619 family protein n=1 Tax=Methylibium sp. TaxID=2067992 RepID=UPI002DB687E0|nr:DUF3619 family protein [Methylibium sp.]HEU4460322.1 DUF3619 family protein [Methylibium sp.]
MTTTPSSATTVWDATTVESRFARRMTAVLSQGSNDVPHDIAERLRVSREGALEKARWAAKSRLRVEVGTAGGTQAVLRGGPGWGWRFAALLPAIAVVAGLFLVQLQQADDQAHAVADIDAALLSDDLPPAAYADDGFAEFLSRPER